MQIGSYFITKALPCFDAINTLLHQPIYKSGYGYNTKTNKAERIETLLSIFEQEGNIHHPVQNSTFKMVLMHQSYETQKK